MWMMNLMENIRAYRQIKHIIKKEKINLIHCHNPMGGVVGRLAAHFSGINPYVIYTAHGFHFYEGAPLKNWLLYYTAERFLAKFTNQLITINKEDFEVVSFASPCVSISSSTESAAPLLFALL